MKRRADGSVDFVSPLPCPFNYGSIPGVLGGDGDPLDAVLLGAGLPRGARARAVVVDVVWFTDEGAIDDKLVCVPVGVADPGRAAVRWFFAVYAVAKRVRALLRGRRGAVRYDGVRPARR